MILDDIAASARKRVETAKRRVPLERIREQAAAKIDGGGSSTAKARFRDALAAPDLSFICEVKKASPSKGVIAADFPYRAIAREYEAAGAAAISVLTEPEYFKGSDEYLREIAAAAGIPVLRKDFVVDEYQLYEAKLLGASAVLLICALLDTRTLAAYLGVAHSLGLSALAETHSEEEVASALEAGAGIVGINNRDLKTFAVDLNTTGRLRKLIPDGRLVVSESGIHTADDIRAIRGFGFDAVLVGESLMRSPDKTRSLSALREAAEG